MHLFSCSIFSFPSYSCTSSSYTWFFVLNSSPCPALLFFLLLSFFFILIPFLVQYIFLTYTFIRQFLLLFQLLFSLPTPRPTLLFCYSVFFLFSSTLCSVSHILLLVFLLPSFSFFLLLQ